jgi:hypothetical protein
MRCASLYAGMTMETSVDTSIGGNYITSLSIVKEGELTLTVF